MALVLAVLAPVVTHAVTFVPFKSVACPYTMEYPLGWKVSAGKVGEAFDQFDGGGVSVVVSCLHRVKYLTLKQMAGDQVEYFRNSGYRVNQTTIHNGIARLDMNQGGMYVYLFITFGPKTVMLTTTGGGDLKAFRTYQGTFIHMQDTMKVH